jgi:hypothetical protein
MCTLRTSAAERKKLARMSTRTVQDKQIAETILACEAKNIKRINNKLIAAVNKNDVGKLLYYASEGATNLNDALLTALLNRSAKIIECFSDVPDTTNSEFLFLDWHKDDDMSVKTVNSALQTSILLNNTIDVSILMQMNPTNIFEMFCLVIDHDKIEMVELFRNRSERYVSDCMLHAANNGKYDIFSQIVSWGIDKIDDIQEIISILVDHNDNELYRLFKDCPEMKESIAELIQLALTVKNTKFLEFIKEMNFQ